MDEAARIRQLLDNCKSDPNPLARFNSTILGRGAYWWRQVEFCQSIADYVTTLGPTGNGVGKSFMDAGAILGFLYLHPNCKVVATAPSQTQLEEVLWAQVESAYRGSRIPLGGRLMKEPLKVDLGGEWNALAYSTTKVERLSGHHRGEMLAVIDEASGVPPEIIEAIDSTNPSRKLLTGNPLHCDGPFYERCQAWEDSGGAVSKAGRKLDNVICVPSLESPDIDLERSPRGLADATWLETSRNDYGEGSIWWICHVLGLFPDAAADTVIPRDWLNKAGRMPHLPAGHKRVAVDLGEGRGGDRSVVLGRDDNGILRLEWSNTWSLGETAKRAVDLARKLKVAAHRLTWDVTGIGADFANRLEALGWQGATPYRAGASGLKKFTNLRSAAAWRLRQRLDPFRKVEKSGLWLPQHPFSIRPDYLVLLRAELQGLRYTLETRDRIALEPKEEFVKRLRHSPDIGDTLMQSFAFPD